MSEKRDNVIEVMDTAKLEVEEELEGISAFHGI